jgi:hypothetical protein
MDLQRGIYSLKPAADQGLAAQLNYGFRKSKNTHNSLGWKRCLYGFDRIPPFLLSMMSMRIATQHLTRCHCVENSRLITLPVSGSQIESQRALFLLQFGQIVIEFRKRTAIQRWHNGNSLSQTFQCTLLFSKIALLRRTGSLLSLVEKCATLFLDLQTLAGWTTV